MNPTLIVDIFVDRSVNCPIFANTNPIKTALVIGSIFNIVPFFFAGMPFEIRNRKCYPLYVEIRDCGYRNKAHAASASASILLFKY